MDTQKAILTASDYLKELKGHSFHDIIVSKPSNIKAAVNLAKVISKLSPLVGNLIEFNTVEYLNQFDEFKPFGSWIRQDPGFPDAIFKGDIFPQPGFEVKAWFPLATEITARFKDSQNHFSNDQTYVVMLAWLPEFLIYGKPKIIDVVIVSGLSVAQARDKHYHNPPHYIVIEPEDTTDRTGNLQQTNTAGYVFQGKADKFKEAIEEVEGWGIDGVQYKPTEDYQNQLRELMSTYKYRLDTNFAKMDRIVHEEIETFKSSVYDSEYMGKTILDWGKLLRSKGKEEILSKELSQFLGIK